MPTEKNHLHPSRANHKPPPGLQALTSPEAEASLRKMEEEYGKYATSASDVRAMMDKALGDRTLKETLRELDDRE